MHKDSVHHMEKCVLVVRRWATSKRYAGIGGTVQFMKSIYLNRNCLLITAHLKMQVGETTIRVPYKIDTSSESNLMPLYILKKMFKNMPEEQLKGSIKSNVKLKIYNGTHMTQLGTCTVIIKFKNLKKRCAFFVVPANSQALLGMPDTAALNIINLNIDLIQVGIMSSKQT